MITHYYDLGEANVPIRSWRGVSMLPRYVGLKYPNLDKVPIDLYHKAYSIIEITEEGPVWLKTRDKEVGTKLTEAELRDFTFQVLASTIYN